MGKPVPMVASIVLGHVPAEEHTATKRRGTRGGRSRAQAAAQQAAAQTSARLSCVTSIAQHWRAMDVTPLWTISSIGRDNLRPASNTKASSRLGGANRSQRDRRGACRERAAGECAGGSEADQHLSLSSTWRPAGRHWYAYC
ncbi:MAG: hypothetical protein HEQ38_00070 [Gemmatimonas sp.]|uniref:hypothetical protein n=1 Tax=Gemmatimonas sp. TaxID=1962908 RepID=UPI0031CC2AFE|nr:hypothetical protein [Gemmatimonas sp.]